ncbi:MAG: B12-binding domain-containing radical SAM protein [Candidatus Hydrogenedentes bacterium]|nr:B12-binding domain-containing radical SAM protein [Candidatus Hydrogenedentota bacterium]
METLTATRPITLIRLPSVTNPVGFVGSQAAPSLALAYLGAVLREAGHSVVAIDCQGEGIHTYRPLEGTPLFAHGLLPAEILARIPKDSLLIGISCMFHNEWIYHQKLIRMIAAEFPGIPLIVGGEHATAAGEYILRTCPWVTACALGEGEETIIDLANALLDGRPLSSVGGLLIRSDEGEGATRTDARSRIRHLDELPWPAWDLLPIQKYFEARVGHGVTNSRNMPMLASRGCPYRCTFCSNPKMWGKLWTPRSAKDVVAEMKYYKEHYQVETFSFYDLTAVVKKSWIMEFTNLLIEENLQVRWLLPSGTRSEALDQEVLHNLKKSGCFLIIYAPENGSPEMLKRIQKQVDLEKMLTSVRAARREGLISRANIIHGMPGETWRDILITWGYIVRLAWAGMNDVSVFPFSPYPGSKLHEQLREKGAIPPEGEEYDMVMALNLSNNYAQVRSWNDDLSARELRMAIIISSAIFYSTQFIFRPWRVAVSSWRLATGHPVTLMERVVVNGLARFGGMIRGVLVDRKATRPSTVVVPAGDAGAPDPIRLPQQS